MADITAVETAIVQAIVGALYPNGTGSASITAGPIKVYPGWPNSQTLDDDMAAGAVHVSVYPRPGDSTTSSLMGDNDWREVSNNGTTGTLGREIRRQTKQFQVTTWAPTPDLRSIVANAVDVILALTPRINMADNSQTLLAYVNQAEHDERQTVQIYRRDLFYAANFALTQNVPGYAVQNVTTHLQPQIAAEAGRVDIGALVTRTKP